AMADQAAARQVDSDLLARQQRGPEARALALLAREFDHFVGRRRGGGKTICNHEAHGARFGRGRRLEEDVESKTSKEESVRTGNSAAPSAAAWQARRPAVGRPRAPRRFLRRHPSWACSRSTPCRPC